MTTLLDSIAADVTGNDVFYNTLTGFAETVGYPAGADFTGIWEEDYQELDADGYVRVSGTAPACWCRTTAAPAIDEVIVRAGTNYVIVEHQPNDDGETLLILREQ